MTTSTIAGFNAKIEGHLLEKNLAHKLGPDFMVYDDGKNKTDLMSIDKKIRISLKNSDKAHTQVALIGQKTYPII